jgi:O-6-methylguanine DNA methyltransferase
MEISRPETESTQLFYTSLKTPLGNMLAMASDHALQLLEFREMDEVPTMLTNMRKTGKAELTEFVNEVLQNTMQQLQEYFEKNRREFSIPLEPEGSKFQKMVWKELLNVPYGKTTSYQKQAEAMGNIMVIRAMAAANGKNPIAIVIPCHRVIGSNGALTGYAGGLWRKKWLLEHEGALLKQMELF